MTAGTGDAAAGPGAAPVPAEMLAYVVSGPTDAGLRRVPVPVPGPGEVLLRVRATALNRKDLSIGRPRTGPGLRPVRLPLVPGAEVVGTVVAAGEPLLTSSGGTAPADWGDVALGDDVLVDPGLSCGRCRWCRVGETSRCPDFGNYGEQRWGGLAEYAVAPRPGVRRLPVGASADHAAAWPVSFTTAWRALVTAGRLRPGEVVLVTGVGGGVAAAGLQVALLAGATVLVTSSSAAKVARAVSMGASAGVDRTAEDVVAWVHRATGGRGVDLVLDGAGATWRDGIRSLAPGGRLCAYGATAGDSPELSVRELYQSHRSVLGTPLGGRGDLDAVWDLVAAGRLRPVVHSTHPLAEVGRALEAMDDPERFGKVVVLP